MTLGEKLGIPVTTLTIDGQEYTLRPPTADEFLTLEWIMKCPADVAARSREGVAMLLKIMFHVPYQSALACVDAETARIEAILEEERKRFGLDADTPHIVGK
jgi:hypothetical protein